MWSPREGVWAVCLSLHLISEHEVTWLNCFEVTLFSILIFFCFENNILLTFSLTRCFLIVSAAALWLFSTSNYNVMTCVSYWIRFFFTFLDFLTTVTETNPKFYRFRNFQNQTKVTLFSFLIGFFSNQN